MDISPVDKMGIVGTDEKMMLQLLLKFLEHSGHHKFSTISQIHFTVVAPPLDADDLCHRNLIKSPGRRHGDILPV
jgi:hypothetical protein